MEVIIARLAHQQTYPTVFSVELVDRWIAKRVRYLFINVLEIFSKDRSNFWTPQTNIS